MKKLLLASLCLLTFFQNKQMTSGSGMSPSSSWFSYKTALGLGTIAGGAALYHYYPVIKQKWPSVCKSIINYWNSWGTKPEAEESLEPKRRSVCLSRELIDSLRLSSIKKKTLSNLQKTVKDSRGFNPLNKAFIDAVSAYLLDNNASWINQFKETHAEKEDLVHDLAKAIQLIEKIHANREFEELLTNIAHIDIRDSRCAKIDEDDDLTFQLYFNKEENDIAEEIRSHDDEPIFLITTYKDLSDSVSDICKEILIVKDETTLSDTFNTILAIEDEDPVIIFWTVNKNLASYYKELILTEAYCMKHDCEADYLLQLNLVHNNNYDELHRLLNKYMGKKRPNGGRRLCNNSFRKDPRWPIHEKLIQCERHIIDIHSLLQHALQEAFELEDVQGRDSMKKKILEVADQVNLKDELTAFCAQLENEEGSSGS